MLEVCEGRQVQVEASETSCVLFDRLDDAWPRSGGVIGCLVSLTEWAFGDDVCVFPLSLWPVALSVGFALGDGFFISNEFPCFSFFSG